MKMPFAVIAFAATTSALTGCETVDRVNEGPVEYATRPDYRDVYRRPPPPVATRYDDYRTRREPYEEAAPARARVYRDYDRDGYDDRY